MTHEKNDTRVVGQSVSDGRPTASINEAPRCGDEDFPVWADGSCDRVVCSLPDGHDGNHVGYIDGVQPWRWSP